MKHTIDLGKLDFSKTISELSREWNIPFTTMKRILKDNNLFSEFKVVPLRNKNIERYNLDKKVCIQCNKVLEYDQRNNKFCGHSCSKNHQPKREISEEQKIKARNTMLEKHRNGLLYIPIPTKKDKIPCTCITCNSIFYVLPCYVKHRKYCSKDCSDKSTVRGGYRKEAGTRYSGWYRGYFCNSSWELAWIIFSLEHDVKFSRNLEGFDYNFDGSIYKYYPDFLLEDSTFIEIKGYETEQWKAKLQQFPKKIKVISKKEMKPILVYVRSKYGKQFINLYEKINKVNENF